MSDSIEILSSLHNHEEPRMPEYSREQWSYIPDFNNGSYPTQIQFTTKDIKNKKVYWPSAYLQVPISVYANTSANPLVVYTRETKIALKNSVFDFIYGMTMNNIGQGTIVNDNQIQFINNLRMLLDTNSDFILNRKQELLLDFDSTVWNSAAPLSKPTSTAGLAAGNNSGFLNRITFLQQQGFRTAGAVANSFQFLVSIPLALCHPIFRAMDFVMYGSNFELYFAMSFMSNNMYPPFMVDTSGGAGGAGTIVVPSVSITPNAGPCRLYYKSVEFETAEAEAYANQLERGVTFVRDYMACDVYSSLPGLQNNSEPQPLNNYVITPSIVNPTGLYVLLFPPNSISGPAIGNTIGTKHGPTSLDAGTPTVTPVTLLVPAGAGLTTTNLPRSPVGTLSNTSIYLNQTSVFPDTQLINSYDYWTLLKQRLAGASSEQNSPPISYSDFLTSQRIHYFDLSKTAVPFGNNSVNLTMTSGRGLNQDGSADTAPMDIVFLVEKKVTVRFIMSSGACLILSGAH